MPITLLMVNTCLFTTTWISDFTAPHSASSWFYSG